MAAGWSCDVTELFLVQPCFESSTVTHLGNLETIGFQSGNKKCVCSGLVDSMFPNLPIREYEGKLGGIKREKE